VIVRVGEAVSVMVGERVAVCDAAGVGVGVSASLVGVSLAGTVGVSVGGTFEGVAVVTTSGTSIKVDIAASRIPAARRIGMEYLRSISGKADEVVTGFLPAYPRASSRFLKLTA